MDSTILKTTIFADGLDKTDYDEFLEIIFSKKQPIRK